MLVHSNTKLANLRETSVSFFVYCLFFAAERSWGRSRAPPPLRLPPPERSEELFAVVCRTSIFNLPRRGFSKPKLSCIDSVRYGMSASQMAHGFVFDEALQRSRPLGSVARRNVFEDTQHLSETHKRCDKTCKVAGTYPRVDGVA